MQTHLEPEVCRATLFCFSRIKENLEKVCSNFVCFVEVEFSMCSPAVKTKVPPSWVSLPTEL